MKRKMLVIGIGIVSLVLLLTLPLMAASTPAPATKVIKWRMQSFLVPTSGSGWDVTVRFTQKVKEMSGGRLEIEVYPSGALVGTMQMLEAVGKGMVEAGTGGPIYWTGTLPVLALADVPMTMGSVNHNEAAHLWWNMGLIDVMRAEYAKAKVFLVGPIMCTVYGETMSKKPIRTLADFKGLKLRSFGMVGDLWKAFGASIVSVTIPEMYTALATGTIDAANVSGLSGFYTYKLHEVAKYAIGPPVLDSIRNDFFVNMDKWKALPPRPSTDRDNGGESMVR